MNVVLLDFARIRRRPARSNSWTSDEMEELARLYRAKCDQGSAVDFAYGDTDHHDPQFYVLNSHDAQPCAACVSARKARASMVSDRGWTRCHPDGRRRSSRIGQSHLQLLGIKPKYTGPFFDSDRSALRKRWAAFG